MIFTKDLEKNELDDLIKKILNKSSIDDKEKNIDKQIDNLDFFSEPFEKFQDNIHELTEETYDLFMKENNFIPDSYKLNITCGDNVFKGYYESIMTDLKNTKITSYSSFSREMESENLQNALTIIKDKKEKNDDSFLFDYDTKRKVDAYKWSNIVWWHILYDLQGKTVF